MVCGPVSQVISLVFVPPQERLFSMVGLQVLAVRLALALVVRQEQALVLATTPLFI